MRELWKDIDTPSGGYAISNLGRVKSKGRWLEDKNGKRRFWKEKILVSTFSGSGYLCIVLERVNYWTHRLVAKAFIPNPENKRCINHKDGDKANNIVSNLEWVTYKENMKHAREKGLHKGITPERQARGSRAGNSKLTEDKVFEIVKSIVKQINKGISVRKIFESIGKTNGVCSGTIEDIWYGLIWKHVKRPEGCPAFREKGKDRRKLKKIKH